MKNKFFSPREDSFFVEAIKMIVLALLIVIPIRYFLFQPFFVQGSSMYPSFEDRDYLVVDQITYRFREPKRGEVVIFKYPKDPSQLYIKRIIGMPGESLEIKNGEIIIINNSGELILNEKYVSSDNLTLGNIKAELGENEYFLLGDNRMFSSDSRRWGAVPRENIIGKAYLRAWPIDSISVFSYPKY